MRLHSILYSFFAVAVATLLSACNIEKDLAPDLSKETPPRLVINGVWEAGEKSLICLSSSAPTYVSGKPRKRSEMFALAAAQVKLYVNGALVDTQNLRSDTDKLTQEERHDHHLTSQEAASVLVYRMSYRPQPGERLRLEVSSPGYETAYVEETIPLAIELLGVRHTPMTSKKPLIDGESESMEERTYVYDRMEIEFRSPLHPKVGYFAAAVQVTYKEETGDPAFAPARTHNDLIGVSQNTMFPKSSIALARFLNEYDYTRIAHPYAIPYFSSAGVPSSPYSLTLVRSEEPGASYRVSLYALSEACYEFAVLNYGLNVPSYEFGIELIETELLAEQEISLSNVVNGRGVVVARTPTVIYDTTKK